MAIGNLISTMSTALSFVNLLALRETNNDVQDIEKELQFRSNLLSSDIKALILASGTSSAIPTDFSEIIELRKRILELESGRKDLAKTDELITLLNNNITVDIPSILSILKMQGMTMSEVLQIQEDTLTSIINLNTDQLRQWRDFQNIVFKVVSNLEFDINEIGNYVTVNEKFQMELSFQMISLKAEVSGQFQALNAYLAVREQELDIKLRSLGALQNNSVAVLTEMGDLVYSQNATNISVNPLIAGPMVSTLSNGTYGISLQAQNLRNAKLDGNYPSFIVSAPTYIQLSDDYNGETLYVAIRTQGNAILEASTISTLVTIKNVTRDKYNIYRENSIGDSGDDDYTYSKRKISTVTSLLPATSPLCFHFGYNDGSVEALPDYFNVVKISGSKGLTILKLVPNDSVKNLFNTYSSKLKILRGGAGWSTTETVNYMTTVPRQYYKKDAVKNFVSKILDSNSACHVKLTDAMARLNGVEANYREDYRMTDHSTTIFNSRVLLKLEAINISIDGISTFRV